MLCGDGGGGAGTYKVRFGMKDKWARREKNRQHELEIKRKLQPTHKENVNVVSRAFRSLSGKTKEVVVEKVAGNIISKAGVTTEDTQENLKRYSKVVLGLISMVSLDHTGQGLQGIRQNIITNLPPDLRKKWNEGKSADEIIRFYWDVPEFVEVFKKLGWDREFLEGMVEGEMPVKS